ncbi:MAG: hypothetical protein JJT81_16440, partial [Rubellimicrobium sp.]|nr:hypothetical protein [Rubellimicrobium sp.]
MKQNDWPEVTVDEVAADVTVGHVGPMANEYLDFGVPFLRSLSVERFGIREEGLKFISPEFHAKLKKSALAPGDVVIVRTGKPGTCAVIPDWLSDANCSDLVIVRCGPRVRPHFLCYIVNSVAGGHIDSHTVGAVQQHFNVGSARTLSFLLPPLDEQDRILALLRGLDDKIELNRKMNPRRAPMARALFGAGFGYCAPTRPKAEGRAPYLSPDLWPLFPARLDAQGKPEGWAIGTLNDLASLNPESWTARNAPDRVAYVDLANTKWGNIDQVEDYAWADAPSRARRILRAGDTIVGTVRPGNGSFCYVGEDGLTGSTGFAVLRPQNPRDRAFVWCAATAAENIDRLAHLADGGAYPAVKSDAVAATEIIVPSEVVLAAF